MNPFKVNRIIDKFFHFLAIGCTVSVLTVLVVLIGDVLFTGLDRIDWDFFTSLPSRNPDKSGILTSWTGTVWILLMTAIIAIPLGIAAGVYLEEYGRKNRITSIIEINISNLAGVPSIIYGLLGLEIFGRMWHLGTSILTGAFTLSLLILPILIVSTREALRAVPNSIREASFAMGATQWQTIFFQVLPAGIGGIMTGIILSLSRAMGEIAPLIVVGALAYVPFVPSHPMDDFTVLPMQIFNWISRPQKGFLINAAAAIIILLFITLIMNGIAMYLRNRWQKRISE